MSTKVAGYCRVASEDRMALERQKDQLLRHIGAHPDWNAGTIYTDAAPANQLANGSGRAQLLEDAAKGEFQRLVVPSLSRLARNTVCLLQIVNELKKSGVTVDFLKEGLSSDDLPNWR